MNFKRIFLIVLAIVSVETSVAQRVDMNQETVINQTGKTQVRTNRFWDNWFLDIGAGAQVYFGDHDKQVKFSERLTPNFELNIGKWISPEIGIRAGINGFKVKGATQSENLSSGTKYSEKPWSGYRLYDQDFDYFHFHGDILFNLSNIISGYKHERLFAVSPYVGLGWIVTNNVSPQRELTASIGWSNSFRISKVLDLTFDMRGAMINDRFDSEVGNRNQDGVLSAIVGLRYKFKKRDWDKPKTATAKYDDELICCLREKVYKLSKDNTALKEQLRCAKNKTITQIKIQEKILASPILVTFQINESVVNNEARVNLGFLAEAINSGNKNIVYQITGYADKDTGTKEINKRLSSERAKSIYNVLVQEFEVSPTQLHISYEGGVENKFYDDPRLSRAVITIAAELNQLKIKK